MNGEEHYFSASPRAPHDREETYLAVGGRRLWLATDAGVFAKGRVDRGTRLLIESFERGRVPLPESGDFCDLGCGYGPIGLALAVLRPEARVYLVDVNERAVALARENAERNGLHNVQVAAGSGLAPFAGRRFALIATNPPLRTGKRNVQALLTEAHASLVPGGGLALVIRTQQGARSMERFLQELFGAVHEADKGGGFRVYYAVRA